MATINGVTIALDVDPITGSLFEPEPFFFFDPIVANETEIIFPVESLDGRDFFLQLNFQIVSATEILASDLLLLNTDFSVAGSATELNLTASLTTDLNSVVFEALVGADVIDGTNMDDRASGFLGNDFFLGRGGNDVFFGNQDHDVMYGNQGEDTLFGGQGLDRIFGGQGSDVVYGNFQDDVIYGNFGNDVLFGGQDQDILYGGRDDDVMLGNLGADTLIGNKGNDELWGGPDADMFVFSPGSGFDTIKDFQAGIDTIQIQGAGANLVQSDADVLINLDSGEAIVVENTTIAEIEADVVLG